MTKLPDILLKAQERAHEANLPYAGALLPQEAYDLLQLVQGSRLIDVRTQAELDWVGYVPDSLHVEWSFYPDGTNNPGFIQQIHSEVGHDTLLFFMCRSGARSHAAAKLATESGFINSYNVLQGFEGDKDHHGHRNTSGGWRHAGLPWKQS
ncbi:MAG: rhodanese [Ferrovum sp. 37-45-19]|jgi:rhodanese-related sulfurtransferase|uniref:rhodanese-like domain-containing protein n=1 Tax=Ferrovum sp. JA12 TaxID=1356299 RepID=UPI00070399FE|nr:rhodanese-like domain-containing protein [Ferrovum sp. JA12]OYV79576.1 MAG: rhodanese [Ferrovum sp. 21-44-67]OYV94630.1 MAG: rhodanese [Ferrovum sp. 37-45-19]OZB34544.1 MAG: rhodanese [Ferrovum sp. 34-44-207]HQT81496.1 rhodanese-like domain-containing protein [Ferrovaceae bacterium]KRH79465.1 rhodanese-like domain protein [Ferrovum sp. JA12]